MKIEVCKTFKDNFGNNQFGYRLNNDSINMKEIFLV